MKVAGIIAEFNPLHNGHKYLMEQTRLQTGADYIVIIMSGDFVQRGTPAIFDKYVRTRMALQAGADLVIELPVCYATASAEFFAQGAVTLLNNLGIVDILSFGSECGDVALLKNAALLLHEESEAYQLALRVQLKKGLSFPAARLEALKLSADPQRILDITKVLSSPNNILGIEYCKALLSLKSSIEPYTIKRLGAGYHEETILDSSFSSATAIRQSLEKADCEIFRNQVPDSVYAAILEQTALHVPLTTAHFSQLLQYKLWLDFEKGYTAYADVSSDLSDKIRKNLNGFTTFDAFCETLKSKDLTYTRISRCLLHILLTIHQPESKQILAPYARMLGFRKEAAPLLNAVKKQSGIPLLSKLADASDKLSVEGNTLLTQDIQAAHIYESVISQLTGKPITNEYVRPLIFID